MDDRLRGSPLACSTKDFRAYCAFFARHFHVITLGELLRRMRTGASLSRCLVITFDDGYEDNYLFAAPVLREHGLTACFFITSEFIGSSIRPVWDREYGVPSPWMSWEQVASLREQGFEIGLHFERRGRELNDALMQQFTPHAFEIKHALGEGVHFERWDKGWSKIYETVPLAPYDETYLEQIAARMAALIACLQPILSESE